MPYQNSISFSNNERDTLTTNINFLSPVGFRMTFDKVKYPNLQYFVKAVSIPDISVQSATIPTPFREFHAPGGTINYADLELTFLVDESMTNYKEVHDWMLGQISNVENDKVQITRDLTLTVLTSHNNPSVTIRFADAFPVSLSSLRFDTSQTSIEYLEASATFEYSYYRFE